MNDFVYLQNTVNHSIHIEKSGAQIRLCMNKSEHTYLKVMSKHTTNTLVN